MPQTSVFVEKQRFTQWWVWLFVLLPVFLILLIVLFQLISGQPVGNKPASNTELLVLLFVLLPLPVLFFTMQLTTRITDAGIEMQYRPILNKAYSWNDIQSAAIKQYGFVGYGIRYSFKYGWVYNVKGNKGLLLKLQNGKSLIIGTQKPAELQTFLRKLKDRDIVDLKTT